ncbi:MAG: hypothetical protein EA390_15250 [Balneolaceae bacterium]|nr:MAG: hypothetical protein EA390_15250 [Balneolaceae bacterium]
MGNNQSGQGYVYNSFGDEKYLKHAVASVATLRRYDTSRPVALYCTNAHKEILEKNFIAGHFTQINILPVENASLTGFKHNVHKFMPFEKNLYIDSDIVWCKNPESLWSAFTPYRFTVTGNQTSDLFFGGPKGVGILKDLLLYRRKKTLKRFGLTYLSRVQTGMIYSSDVALTKAVCKLAGEMLEHRHKTHFRSRTEEEGRSEESCEWSIAMAMATLEVQVYPWLFGYNSPQLDFIENYTEFDEEFNNVKCLLYSDRFVYDLKAVQINWLRKSLIALLSLLPGKGDYLYATPYCLHFGWYNQKEPFNQFSESVWSKLTS